MTLFFLLNPKHGNLDTSDVLRRRIGAYKRKERKEEEQVAAQILLQRLLNSQAVESEVKEEIAEILETSSAVDLQKLISKVKQIIPLFMVFGDIKSLTIPITFLTQPAKAKLPIPISDKLLKTIIIYSVLDDL
jgi:hypothetical protein